MRSSEDQGGNVKVKTVLTRRFYFDDGKSRKRWQISQTGKSVATQFGRLTGALRESKKVTMSLGEAQKLFDQLIAEKLREGYVEVAPERLEIIRNKGVRAANEKQVGELESSLGCKLPTEFHNFLLSVNGGRPNPDCVRVPGLRISLSLALVLLFHLQAAKPGMDEITYEFSGRTSCFRKATCRSPVVQTSSRFHSHRRR